MDSLDSLDPEKKAQQIIKAAEDHAHNPMCFRCKKLEASFFPVLIVYERGTKTEVAQSAIDVAICHACQPRMDISHFLTDSIWWQVTKRMRNDLSKLKLRMPDINKSLTQLDWRMFTMEKKGPETTRVYKKKAV